MKRCGVFDGGRFRNVCLYANETMTRIVQEDTGEVSHKSGAWCELAGCALSDGMGELAWCPLSEGKCKSCVPIGKLDSCGDVVGEQLQEDDSETG